jgi:hypothetical protein
VDDRFREATVEISRPLLSGIGPEAADWWFRIPKSPSAELEEDLRSEGLLDE